MMERSHLKCNLLSVISKKYRLLHIHVKFTYRVILDWFKGKSYLLGEDGVSLEKTVEIVLRSDFVTRGDNLTVCR